MVEVFTEVTKIKTYYFKLPILHTQVDKTIYATGKIREKKYCMNNDWLILKLHPIPITP